MSTGGITLTVFELLTATFAANGLDLRQHWEKECQGAWSGSEYWMCPRSDTHLNYMIDIALTTEFSLAAGGAS